MFRDFSFCHESRSVHHTRRKGFYIVTSLPSLLSHLFCPLSMPLSLIIFFFFSRTLASFRLFLFSIFNTHLYFPFLFQVLRISRLSPEQTPLRGMSPGYIASGFSFWIHRTRISIVLQFVYLLMFILLFVSEMHAFIG